MRLALFGGTFDPIHRGHLALAAAAASRFHLDRVLIAPTGRQPLKSEPIATFEQRLAMVSLACVADERFSPSDIDAPHPDGTPNYTVDTLQTLTALYPSATLFTLSGADSFHSLAHWRSPQLLLTLTDWIVVSRPNYPLADPKNLPLTPAQRARIPLLDDLHDPISATDLRARLATGDPCSDLLPPNIPAYIQLHHLYTSQPEP